VHVLASAIIVAVCKSDRPRITAQVAPLPRISIVFIILTVIPARECVKMPNSVTPKRLMMVVTSYFTGVFRVIGV
jgi:hypothetical protein